MRKIIITLFFLVYCCFLGNAFESKSSVDSLRKIKKLYLKKDYERVRLLLDDISTAQAESDPNIAYVKFYHALIEYRCGNLSESILILEDLYKKQGSWSNSKEICYWLGVVNFEMGNYYSGLDFLQKIVIKNDDIKDLQNVKFYFLSQCKDFSILKKCFKLYPEDFVLARVLIDKLNNMSIYERDLDLVKLLANKFGLYLRECVEISKKRSLKKKTYNIAVFLPVFTERLQGEISLESDFVFDFYQGLVIGVNELNDGDSKINLCVYDTKRDATIVQDLLEKPEMQGMDLIIGPLYPETILLVSEFSHKYEIPMFNPLSENLELIGSNPFFFLFQPSLYTKAVNAAKFTLKKLKPDSKIAIIYNSASKSDIFAADVYKNYIEENSDFKISINIAIKENDSSSFLGYYIKRKKKGGGGKDFYTYPIMDEATHMYVPSKDEIIATSVMSAIEIIGNKALVIADESWLGYNSIGFDQIVRANIVFISPTYINYDKENIYDFRKRFIDAFGQFPSIYSIIGYELVSFLGKQLQNYGTGFIQTFLDDKECERRILGNIRYEFSHDNQLVPIIGLDKQGKMVCYNQ